MSEKEPRFIVDTMLGNIARWLRLLGYDTLYYRRIEDWRILEIARKDDRIIITRDRSLCNRAYKKKIKAIYLEQNDMAERLAYLSMKTGIRLFVDLEKSRCPICNGELVKVSKELVKGRVPRLVYEKHNDFWICRKCGKVYWMGKHWKGIEETLRKAREILDNMVKSRGIKV